MSRVFMCYIYIHMLIKALKLYGLSMLVEITCHRSKFDFYL